MMISKNMYEDKFIVKVYQAGYKITPPRVYLIDLLRKTKKPLTTANIITQLKKNGVNKATVYRNLKVLEDSKVIQQVDFRDSGMHYELVSDNHHHHLVCMRCKTVEDFYNCSVDKIVNSVLKKSDNFSAVESHTMEMFGLCKTCYEN